MPHCCAHGTYRFRNGKSISRSQCRLSSLGGQSSSPKMSPKNCLLQLASIGPKNKLANRMKKMRDELKEITDQHSKFRLEVGSASNEHKFPDARETAMVMNDEEVIAGRTEEKMEIMVSLSKSIEYLESSY